MAIDYEKVKIESTIDTSRFNHLQRIKNRSFINHNKKRTYGTDEQMKRWVGTSINFEEPRVDKVSIKLSKKAFRKVENERAISVPNLIKSQNATQLDTFFHLPKNSRYYNGDNFIYMEGNRKVGRQSIPPEFRKREESLQKVVSVNTSLDAKDGLTKVLSPQNLEAMRSLMEESKPTFDKYPHRKSLPFSSSLRALAEKSVSGLS